MTTPQLMTECDGDHAPADDSVMVTTPHDHVRQVTRDARRETAGVRLLTRDARRETVGVRQVTRDARPENRIAHVAHPTWPAARSG